MIFVSTDIEKSATSITNANNMCSKTIRMLKIPIIKKPTRYFFSNLSDLEYEKLAFIRKIYAKMQIIRANSNKA